MTNWEKLCERVRPHKLPVSDRPKRGATVTKKPWKKTGDGEKTIALEEIQKIGQFFSDNGYKFRPIRRTPFGNQFYGGCTIIGNTVRGVCFIISIWFRKPSHERYSFSYQTDHIELYEFEDKYRKISEKFGTSEFSRGTKNPKKGYIRFKITDPKNEVLDIINKTKEIMGF